MTVCRDWNFSSREIATILSISELGGAVAGFIVPVADVTSLGKKLTAALSIAVMGATMLGAVGPPDIATLTVLRFVYLIALNVLYAIIQAISHQLVSDEKRGRITGALELSWSLSLFIAVPLLSLSYEALDWRAPFVILGSSLFVMCFIFWIVVPADEAVGTKQKTNCKKCTIGMGQTYINCLSRLGPCLLTTAIFLHVTAHHCIFTAYAYFAEEKYGLTAEELGKFM